MPWSVIMEGWGGLGQREVRTFQLELEIEGLSFKPDSAICRLCGLRESHFTSPSLSVLICKVELMMMQFLQVVEGRMGCRKEHT
jgi:hypothetical protein